jgi:hypothetical protein
MAAAITFSPSETRLLAALKRANGTKTAEQIAEENDWKEGTVKQMTSNLRGKFEKSGVPFPVKSYKAKPGGRGGRSSQSVDVTALLAKLAEVNAEDDAAESEDSES